MDYDRRVMFSGSPALKKVDLYMENADFQPATPTAALHSKLEESYPPVEVSALCLDPED